jgi:hypothetical protein
MNTIADAALGGEPARWPLPPASTPGEHWLRAVAAGGQGRYATALTDLDVVSRSDAGPHRSLAASTRASFLRQLGWHVAARPWDGRALALAGTDPDARADALIGLAADALGVGRFALSARLLDRATEIVGVGASQRLPVRLSWVSAELAMFTGRGTDAVRFARRAVALAADLGSTRHGVKSDVVHAAALCSAGALDEARHVADDALRAAQAAGLVPLSWALACLLGDIGSAVHPPDTVAEMRTRSASVVEDRGGTWASR